MGGWFWRVGTIAASALVLAAVPSPGAAGAPASPERTIVIDVVAPPSLEGALQAGLWLDGVDVTGQYCQEVPAARSGSGDTVLRCDDLPDGVGYRVGLVEPIPGDTVTVVECQDGIGTRTPTPSIPWASVAGWDCQVWASSPSIVLDTDSGLLLANELPAQVEWIVRDLDGNAVSSECEPDQIFGRTFLWCPDLVLAGHTVELVPPAGYRGDLLCAAVAADPVSWTGTLELTEEAPIWRCEVGSIDAPLSVRIDILDSLAPTWIDGIDLVVQEVDGLDASEFCEIIGISESDQGEIWTHRGRADCPGLPAGTYEVTFSGVPDDVVFGAVNQPTPCRTEITDDLEGGCIFEFRADRELPPDTTLQPEPTSPTVVPNVILPATGSPPTVVPTVAIALLVAGAALITITRRTPESATEQNPLGRS